MYFSAEERAALLQLKGVGATVLQRLEQLGYGSFAALRGQQAAHITKAVSHMMGSTCWHNSPQARAAIQAVLDLANRDSATLPESVAQE